MAIKPTRIKKDTTVTKTTKVAPKSKPENKDKYAIYRTLTAYLTEHNDKLLLDICKDKKEADRLRYRVISHILSLPRLCWYVNKYINGLYDYNKFTNEQWFRMFADIIRMSGSTQSHHFYFPKYKFSEVGAFYKTIRDYYTLGEGIVPSSSELSSLFTLYKSGHLNESVLDTMKMMIDGKESAPKSTPKKQETTPFGAVSQMLNGEGTRNKIFDDLSPEIQLLTSQCREFKKSRTYCRGCELKQNQMIAVDTNLISPGPVDVTFLGLSPTKEETIPFTNSGGELFRSYFDKIVQDLNIKYMLSNVILCSVPHDTPTGNINACTKNCSEIVGMLRSQFPSKITVVMGDKAMKAVGIKGSITKLNGKFIDGYFIMLNPSAIQHNANSREKLETAFAQLREYLATGVARSQNEQTASNAEFAISNDKILSRLDNSHTLFDTKVIGEKIMYIMKDSAGNKKYYFEDAQIPIYIKGGSYRDCSMISNNSDQTLLLSVAEKDQLVKMLRYNMQKHVAGEL